MSPAQVRTWLINKEGEEAASLQKQKYRAESTCKRCGGKFKHTPHRRPVYCGTFCASEANRGDFSRFYELHMQGLTAREIAKETGTAKSTVYGKILRHKLRHDLLNDEEREENRYYLERERARKAKDPMNHA